MTHFVALFIAIGSCVAVTTFFIIIDTCVVAIWILDVGFCVATSMLSIAISIYFLELITPIISIESLDLVFIFLGCSGGVL